LREGINIATSGSNHGWSYQEGNLSFDRSPLVGQRPTPFHGREVLPVHSYPHANNNGAVIGGFVYQGNKYPELRGKYLYGDNTSGRIWAFSRDENNRAANVELLTVPATAYTGISSLAADADGEVLISVLGDMEKEEGRIYRIEPAPPGTQSSLPSQLSDTGIFTDLETLEPSPGFLPYEVNVPAWSDGAVVRRWVLVPGDGSDPDPSADRVGYAANGPWTFPVGTVFVQHFELPVDRANPSVVRRLETRILVCHAEDGVYGVSYRWNEEGSEATLVDKVFDETIPIRGDDGDDQELTWTYADSQTCLACHNRQAGFVLGVNTRQLNRDVEGPFGFGAENQLLRWTRGGLFTTSLNATDLAHGPRLSAVGTASSPAVEHRVRSYLDVNCAHCHQPGGVRANFDARFQTPLAAAGLIDGRLHAPDADDSASHGKFAAAATFGIREPRILAPGDPFRSVLYFRMSKAGQGRMPRLGSHRVDVEALRMIHDWILEMPLDGEHLTDQQLVTDLIEQTVTSHDVPVGIIEQLLSSTRGTFGCFRRTQRNPSARSER